ncbi:amino acid transporter [Adhaeribacter aerolatus]|uniref:Amino acid transporter n=1 Tax=Adhaeribacter aerolatus TaxID=670289 RepID=A0A512ARZ4_9BACT|nr:amino acid permease [Adhaeribacter aerolatus]GEO02337.1 amino acid transporter [Adhaeribacter aerolatus]
MASKIFARKSINKLLQEAEGGHSDGHGGHTLKRTLSATNLIMLGIGAIIGTGIFVLTGSAAAQFAGPGLVLSFIIAGIGCAFAGLCYAEFASMIPIAGSAYTYGYATLGELVAWIIGWDLILEYMFGAATVAVGWSGYLVSFLRDLGINIPPMWWNAPGIELVQDPKSQAWLQITDQLTQSYASQGLNIVTLPHATGVFNLVAAGAILLVTVILVIGIQESAKFNNFIVFIKLFVVFAFVLAGGYFIFRNPELAADNWTPFVPENTGEFGHYGWSGILRAAGVIFFAYIGFDAVSTAAQEAKNPQRDMPIGILGSLVICTILYILVSGILTGLVDYRKLNVAEPIALGIEATGYSILTDLIKIGAVAGLGSVMLVLLLGQPRIFYSMSRDGLIPPFFGKIHPRFQTPYVSSILIGVVCAITAGALPIAQLGEMTSIGTLLAFVIVCGGVWYLRVKEPDRPRPFRTPLVPLVPILGIVVCLAMMAGLNIHTWYRLLGWLAIGLVVYFLYSRHHSKLNKNNNLPDAN